MTNPVTAAIWLYKIGSKLLTGPAKNIPKGATKLSQHPTQGAANKALSSVAVKTQKGVTKGSPGTARGLSESPAVIAKEKARKKALYKPLTKSQWGKQTVVRKKQRAKDRLTEQQAEEMAKTDPDFRSGGYVKNYARGGDVRPAMNEYRGGDKIKKQAALPPKWPTDKYGKKIPKTALG